MDLWFLKFRRGDTCFIRTGFDDTLVQVEVIQPDKNVPGNWIIEANDLFISVPGKELQKVK